MIKKILFFVAAGIVREAHRAIATAINHETGATVSFRNADVALHEKPETCDGFAGVPLANYKEAGISFYDEKGREADPDGKSKPKAKTGPASTGERPLNALGIPEGGPDNVEDLRKALEEAGETIHPRTGEAKLVALYMAKFHPQG